MVIPWEPLRDVLMSNQRFVLSSHVRPDADAIGSELGLAAILEALGKEVRIVNPSAIPQTLNFLDPEGRVFKIGDGIKPEDLLDTDVHIVVDTSSWNQLQEVGHMMRKSSARRVVIDHHASSDDLGALEFKDTQAEATGVLILEMADALDLTIPSKVATPLFCAIATDTGWFRFSSVRESTLRAAARLMGMGAQPDVIYRQLYEQFSVGRIRLAGCVLTRVTVDCEGKLAYTWVESGDFDRCGARPVDTEDLVNDCLKIGGTQCAFIAVEQLNKSVKFSFRSRAGVDVAALAEQFGGGGHRQASGATLTGSLPEALKRVLTATREALATQPPPPPQT
ncbi:MAG TPA: bifunctional oligoribonuclease/PAP phosphatase NrnA [Planctomycetaceae bacterium]|jgi:nanoRNase/pAp phosphatase (c-di-AMP/oligoRNAs hydrolase)|nr:bifunctional oligoribonuclease/PAP phosphatase NrnA [Planctomycetaceae bacterium]